MMFCDAKEEGGEERWVCNLLLKISNLFSERRKGWDAAALHVLKIPALVFFSPWQPPKIFLVVILSLLSIL